VARVIAGEAGGRRLAVPDGRDTRPTGDRAREGLFATVSSIVGSLAGARVLDLYAGSGAVGLEALSRGAEHVLLVEHSGRAVRVIRQNIEAIGLPGALVAADRVERVLARGPAAAGGQDGPAPAGSQDGPAAVGGQDGPAAVGGQDGPAPAGSQDGTARDRYDVVFADPPYAMPGAEVARMLIALAEQGWLAPGALVIVERATRSGPLSWPDGFVPDRARRYGEATFWYGHVRQTAAERPMTDLTQVLEHPPKSRKDDTACNA
jgi:16S rRNA (guanine966-N2)-methyltransferase